MEYVVATVLLTIIAALTAVHFLTHSSRSGKLIDQIPGPRFWPIVGNTFDLAVSPEALWNSLRAFAGEYNSIYKVWMGRRPVVHLCHPDDAQLLLSSQMNISKGLSYSHLHPWLNQGLLTSTGDKWRRRRKLLTPAFHFKVLQEFVGVFVENSERMVDTLKREGGEIVKDVVSLFGKFTLNAVCETAMGTALGDDDAAESAEYRRSITVVGLAIYHRTMRPWLNNDWIFSLTRQGREQNEALKVLHDFTSKIIVSRKKYHEKTGGRYLKAFSSANGRDVEANAPDYEAPVKKARLAMLDLLIAEQEERDVIDDVGIREEVDTFIFEGHDTTKMGLSFALLLLAEHKEIQARARAEIDSVLEDSGGKLGINELQKLTYLDRCIKESLRMFPSVPHISRVITDEIDLKKFVVPRGTIATLHIFDVHRHPDFWPRPDVYDPDRFLPDRVRDRHPFSYIPFSAGPRNCIGQKFATLEMKVFIGLLLHNFYLEPTVRVANVRMVMDMVIKSINPLTVKFVPIR